MENIQLTESFFQEFAEDSSFASPQPVLQLCQIRAVETPSICYRLRCSDGIFSYINCGFDKALADKVAADGLTQCGPETFPVIKVLQYDPIQSQDKNTMIIKEYEVVASDVPKIGNPASHSGDANTFKGFGPAKRKLDESMNEYKNAGTPRKIAKSEGGPVMPIGAITPYITGRWRIGGVVSGKEEMRDINSKKGPMKVFSFVLSEKSGQSMKITCFAAEAEKFFPMIQENRSYFVSGAPGCIRPANKRFNSTGHDYEITLNHDSIIEDSDDQTLETPKFVIKKVTLDRLSLYSGQAVDILAVVDKVEEAATIRTKDNREVVKRNVQLIDQTATSVSLTLWGDQAQSFNVEEGRVLGIKGAVVREYNGTYSLSFISGSRVEVDPESNDTKELLQWFEGDRPNAEVKSISTHANAGGSNFVDEARLFATFNNPNLLVGTDRRIYFSNIGVITQIRQENVIYMACPKPDCSKKVTPNDGGQYRCEKCYRSYDNYTWRYMVSMEVTDATSNAWITLFDDKAQPFFGKPAAEMGELQKNDPDAFKAVLNSKLFTIHNFRCRARNETYNDVSRAKMLVFDIRQPNFVQYGDALDATIKQLEAVA
jgi:replication factor A1